MTLETVSKKEIWEALDDDAFPILCTDLTPFAARQVRSYLKQRLKL